MVSARCCWEKTKRRQGVRGVERVEVFIYCTQRTAHFSSFTARPGERRDGSAVGKALPAQLRGHRGIGGDTAALPWARDRPHHPSQPNWCPPCWGGGAGTRLQESGGSPGAPPALRPLPTPQDTWGQRLLQLLRLLLVGDDQGVEVPAAAHLELDIVLVLLDLDGCGIKEEVSRTAASPPQRLPSCQAHRIPALPAPPALKKKTPKEPTQTKLLFFYATRTGAVTNSYCPSGAARQLSGSQQLYFEAVLLRSSSFHHAT